MRRFLDVELCRAADGSPLAVVKNFPGLFAEMTPVELRLLALWLSDAAALCDEFVAGADGRTSCTVSYEGVA